MAFLQPNYPTVNIATYGPQPRAANPWSNFWNSLTPGFMRPGANLDLFGRPLRGTNLGPSSPPPPISRNAPLSGRTPRLLGDFNRSAGPNLASSASQAATQGILNAPTEPERRVALGLPPSIAPANRPMAQYYDQAALTAAAPYANAPPGWYTPGELDRFASVLGPDQLRALTPTLQAEYGRMTAPTPINRGSFEDWLRGGNFNTNAPGDTTRGNFRPDLVEPGSAMRAQAQAQFTALPTTTSMAPNAAWRELARMFPGLGAGAFQNVGNFNQQGQLRADVTGNPFTAQTPEQFEAARAARAARDAAIAAGTYVPPGRQAAPAGFLWGYRPGTRTLSHMRNPNSAPPAPTSYRGGGVRR